MATSICPIWMFLYSDVLIPDLALVSLYNELYACNGRLTM